MTKISYKRPVRVGKSTFDKIKQMKVLGLKSKQIAELVGVSTATVYTFSKCGTYEDLEAVRKEKAEALAAKKARAPKRELPKRSASTDSNPEKLKVSTEPEPNFSEIVSELRGIKEILQEIFKLYAEMCRSKQAYWRRGGNGVRRSWTPRA